MANKPWSTKPKIVPYVVGTIVLAVALSGVVLLATKVKITSPQTAVSTVNNSPNTAGSTPPSREEEEGQSQRGGRRNVGKFFPQPPSPTSGAGRSGTPRLQPDPPQSAPLQEEGR